MGAGHELMQRLSNRVYEACRQNTMSLPHFPDFTPLVGALQERPAPLSNKTYRVCIPQADALLVLESLAAKWLESDLTKQRAEGLISAHNSTYNTSGQYWCSDLRTGESHSAEFLCAVPPSQWLSLQKRWSHQQNGSSWRTLASLKRRSPS